MAYQIAVRVTKYLPLYSGCVNQSIMRNRFLRGSQSIRDSPAPTIRSCSKPTILYNWHIFVENLGWSNPYRLPGCWLRLCEFLSQVSCFCGCSCDDLDPSAPYNPSVSSAGFPRLNLMFVCGSMHLFPSITGWRLSGDNWGTQQSDHRRWPV